MVIVLIFSFDYVVGNFVAEIFYLSFLMGVGIMLLNSLIAFMQGSFGDAIEHRRVAALTSRLVLIYTTELYFFV